MQSLTRLNSCHSAPNSNIYRFIRYHYTPKYSFHSSNSSNKRAQCHYTLLGVNQSSSENEIRIAYRQLAKKFHPDLHSQTPQKQQNASSKFALINNAYGILNDKQKRSEYDLSIGANPPRKPFASYSQYSWEAKSTVVNEDTKRTSSANKNWWDFDFHSSSNKFCSI